MRRLIDTLRFITTHPLTRDAKGAALGRFLAWQTMSRLKGEIVVPWVYPAKLVARRGMAGATGNIYCGLHEFTDMGFLLHFLRPSDTFIDIGANVGSYSVLASGVRGAHSIAVEPDPDTVEWLRKNIALNHIEAKVAVHPVALGDRRGEVVFTVGLDTVNRVVPAGSSSTRVVPQTTLDEIVGDREPAMIKMDVEGYEENVLMGARQTLNKRSLLAVQSELASDLVGSIFREAGFTRQYYDPFTRRLSDDPVAYPSNNALFVRDRESVAERLASAEPVVVLGKRL